MLENRGFIQGWVYGAHYPVCAFNEKIPPCCFLIQIKRPNTQKCTLLIFFLNQTARPAKTPVTP